MRGWQRCRRRMPLAAAAAAVVVRGDDVEGPGQPEGLLEKNVFSLLWRSHLQSILKAAHFIIRHPLCVVRMSESLLSMS